LEVLNQKVGDHIFGRDEKGHLKDSCPTCNKGKLGLRLGKFGAFIGCSNYPECKHTMQLFGKDGADGEDGDVKKPAFEPRTLGKDPKTGAEIMVKVGPYGPYLEMQLEEGVVEEEKPEEKPAKKKTTKKTAAKTEKKTKEKKPKAKKPKRVSIPKTLDINTIDLKAALDLLSLPREVGIHPETGEKIVANIGPFGPYLLHDKKFTSVKEDDILTIGLNRAVDVIASVAEKKAQQAKSGKVRRGGFAKKKK